MFETERPIVSPGEEITVGAVSFVVSRSTGFGVLDRLDDGIRQYLVCSKPIPEPLEPTDNKEDYAIADEEGEKKNHRMNHHNRRDTGCPP